MSLIPYGWDCQRCEICNAHLVLPQSSLKARKPFGLSPQLVENFSLFKL